MPDSNYYIGDVFDRLGEMPDGSVDLMLTSPPFLALRSYLPADHPDKGKEIGQEPSPAEFLDTLLALTAEWGRVLAPHGSIAVELGDTYASHDASPGGANPAYKEARHAERAQGSATGRRLGQGWPMAKSLCIIPELYAACLAYGRNVLTGEPSPAGQWRVRNLVRWVRPNPPVGALGDKFRPATSVMVIACRSKDRWFDLDAVRNDDGGAPPLDWWEVSPEAYKGSHYATWPRKLLVRPILAMCPQYVCRTCGEPRRRIVATEPSPYSTGQRDSERNGPTGGGIGHTAVRNAATTGWTDCGHDDYRHGVVLDPFAGSGTTLVVANGNGRDAIGIDLDARNADLACERVGMFLNVHGEDAELNA